MTALFTYVVLGLAVGALYGLTAMGLVLTYKTSGVFNFAHGATGAAAAYLYYQLRVLWGLPSLIALALCLLVAAPLAGLAFERLSRRLADAPTANKVVATVGVALAVQGLLSYRFGTIALPFPGVLPSATVKVGAVYIGYDQIISFTLALAAAVGLLFFFRLFPLGVQMRAVVDDPDLLGLSGTSAIRVRGTAWVLGSVFASVSGILLAPTIGLDATLLTLIVLQAFGAAAIGTFSSLPLSYAGGLVVGVLISLVQGYFGSTKFLSGLPPSVPFLVLFGVLLLVPAKRLKESGTVRTQAAPGSPYSERVQQVGIGATLLAALAVPFVVGTHLPVYTDALCFVVIFASLNMLVRTSGQVSLCHAGFAAVGAASFAHLAGGAHLPWVLAVVGAGLITVPLGMVVAVPAIRLSGLYLALATFGFGVLLEKLGYLTSFMFGSTGALKAPRPAGFSSDRPFYYVVLAVAVSACVVVGAVNRSRLGRLLRGMADSPTALSTLGLGINSVRVLVFCLAAFLAGIGGAVLASRGQDVNGVPFLSFNSLVWLAVLAISGRGRQSAAILAAISLRVIPSYTTNADIGQLFTPAFGILALVAVLLESRPRRDASEAAAAVLPSGSTALALRSLPGPLSSRRAVGAR